jgi:aminocarboxymuconate-semialdehyde decarboxylase
LALAARVVDVHTHYLPPAFVEAFRRRTEPPRIFEGGAGLMLQYGPRMARPIGPTMIDLDAKLADMRDSGIDGAVLTVNIPGLDWLPAAEAVAVARDTNDQLADAARTGGGDLVALAALPMQSPDDAASELERAVGRGLRGAHIYSNVAGRPLDGPEFRVVFDAAAALEIPISLHPTYPLSVEAFDVHALVPVLGYLADSTGATLRLVFDGLYERHPEFKLMLAHVGSLIPYLVGRIDYESTRMGALGALTAPPSEHLRRLYTDTICKWPPALKLAMDFFGEDKVMFGTDHPFWDPAVTFETLAGAGLSPEADEAVRRGNAVRLFRFDA